MKSASAALASHIAQTATTLATLWRVIRRDGQVFGFTDHDQDIVFNNVTYKAKTGYRRTALSSSGNLSVPDAQFWGVLDSAEIDDVSLRGGLWDGAQVSVFIVNWANLGQGSIHVFEGWLGEVICREDGTFQAETRGLAQRLNQTIGQVYSPECRADLGDNRCKIPLLPPLRQNSTAYAVGQFVRVETNTNATGTYREEERIYECTTAGTTAATPPTFNTSLSGTTTDGTVVWTARQAWSLPGTINTIPNNTTLTAQNIGHITTRPDGWFNAGIITFDTGLNVGISREIMTWTQATRTITLLFPFPFSISNGDVFRIYPGCDKRLDTCRTKFNNRLNFRGEPFVPGNAALTGRR